MSLPKRYEDGKERFCVVYLWQGERHQLLQTFDSKDGAMKAMEELHKSKFRAWVELL